MSSKIAPPSKPIFWTAALAPICIRDALRLCGANRVCWRINVQARSSKTIREEDEEQPMAPAASSLSVSVEEARLKPLNLQFTRLQPTSHELNYSGSREFGEFVAREAVLDEEFWTAAWLRAETHWENQPNDRYANNLKRKFADQEFNAIKRRCKSYHGQRSMCIVAVKKENGNIKRTVLKSVVGTLDLSFRHLLQGETYPGERVNPPPYCSTQKVISTTYGYISNLCIAKSARRKGVATNMMLFAMESAKSICIKQVFVHVHRDNTAAQQLYQNIGFKTVDIASPRLEEENMYLLHCLV